MERSIESIWKEGFLQGDALVAPRLNDLYNQKSVDLISRFSRKFLVNFWAVIGLGLLILGGAIGLGTPWVGGGICLMLFGIAGFSRLQMKRLGLIDRGKTSYEFLREFDAWLSSAMASYARIGRFFYPVFVVLMGIGLWQAGMGEQINEKLLDNPQIWRWWGVPLFYLLPFGVMALVAGVFGGRIYRSDIQAVYGSEMRKLEELLREMERLRA